MTETYRKTKADPARAKLGETNDCTVLALSILTGLPYKIAHRELAQAGRRNGQGTSLITLVQVLRRCHLRGVEQLGMGRKRQTVSTFAERMKDSPYDYLLSMNGHVAAFKDGKVQDWTANRGHYVYEAWRLNR